MTSDAAIRERIAADLGSTLFVDAGAGSGKTTSLVARVVSLVRSGIPLDAIAVITFTEAAASELRQRVRAALVESRQVCDVESGELIEDALDALDGAPIQTLHAFAQRILRSNPIAAGLPPVIGIRDEIASQIWLRKRWDAWFDEIAAEPGMPEIFERLSAIGAVEDALITLADALEQNWDRLDLVPVVGAVPLPPIDRSAVEMAIAAVDAIVDNRPAGVPDDDSFLSWYGTTFAPIVGLLRSANDDAALLVALDALCRLTGGRKGAAKVWGSPADDRAAAVERVKAAATSALNGAIHHACSVVASKVAGFVGASAAERTRTGRLVYADLLVLARNLLRDRPDVRAKVHDRYQRVLLDEFQDTDPLQVELGTLIAAPEGVTIGQRWSDLVVEPGRLFFVGDPKQSIYRFRRADVELYLAARDTHRDGRVSLTANFRSVPDIVDFVNDVFERLMSTRTQAPFERLEPQRRRLGSDPAVEVVGGPLDVPAEGARSFGAESMASLISDHLDPTTPPRWLVSTADDARPAGADDTRPAGADDTRPAGADDIVILIPSRVSLPSLQRALDGCGVQYRLETASLVWSAEEVRDVLSVLRAVDDPGSEIDVVASLRSPLIGCSDVDLLDWRRAGRGWDYLSGVADQNGEGDVHPVAAGMRILAGLHRRRWYLTPDRLVEMILDELGGWVIAAASPRPAEPLRRLRQIIDHARSFVAGAAARGLDSSSDLRAFLEWAELAAGDISTAAVPALAEPGEPAVRIMTIHGSKGREFPVVLLHGLGTKPAGRSGVSVLWDPITGAPEIRLSSKIMTAALAQLAPIDEVMAVEERIRLLYVAMTRARDVLVVGLHHPSKRAGASLAALVCEVLDASTSTSFRRVEPPSRAEVATSPPGGSSRPSPDPDPPPIGTRIDYADRRAAAVRSAGAGRVWSATEIARTGAAPTGGTGPGLDGEPAPAPGSVVDSDAASVTYRRGRSGAAIGRATHATLQLVDLATPTDLDAVASAQASVERLGAEEAIVVARLARAAVESELIKWASGRPHHREMYVAAPVGKGVLEGYIDLLVDAGDGTFTLIDYKTDAVRTPADLDAAADRYRLQGAAYALAVEAVTGRAVGRVVFLFLAARSSGETVALERDIPDLAAALAEVAAVVAGQIGGPDPLSV